MGLFDTRTMLEALRIMKPPQAFLLDKFFRTITTSWTEYVDIDVIKGKRKMAPFVHPLSPGKVENREGYTTMTFKPPYIKPKRVSSAADWLKRMPGENPYANRSVMERAAELMNKDLMEMDEEVTRREEWMAAQQLATGQVVVTGEGVNATINFQWSASHLIANTGLTANGWDQASADPVKDIMMMSRRIVQDSGRTPDVMVFGSEAWDLFLANTKVQELLDRLRITPGNVQPTASRTGAQLMATLLGLEMWLYLEWYIDDAGVEQPMIPADYVIMGSTAARCERHYGAIYDPKALAVGDAPPRVFPKSWEEEDPPVRYVMLQSSPLPVAHEVDAFVRADVKG